MKAILLVALLTTLLMGCGMSHEEYEERTEYCESRGLAVKVSMLNQGGVGSVHCVGEGGAVFNSRGGGK